MLSNTSRWLTYLTAILYAILGLFLFFLSERLAAVFAWKVTPFMTMTIGGWCIGNGWLAFVSARRWDWKLVHPALFYFLRRFAVFYLSLTVGALPLIWERNLSVLLNHAYASYALVIFITAAIFAYFGLFDFASKPGQLIYVSAYFLVGIPILLVLLKEGTGLRQV